MPFRFPPEETRPVEVVDVGSKPVPFLRPLAWVATALRSFRERPLPGTYSTEAQPTFDLFGTSRLEESAVEVVNGGVGNPEVFGAEVAGGKWRQYLSLDVTHDDGAAPHIMRFARVVQDDTLGFPVLVFDVSASLAAGLHFTTRNLSVPSGGRVSAEVDAMPIGAQLFLRALFVEFDVGEPTGGIS